MYRSCRKPEFESITHVEWLTNVCNPSSRGPNTSGFHRHSNEMGVRETEVR